MLRYNISRLNATAPPYAPARPCPLAELELQMRSFRNVAALVLAFRGSWALAQIISNTSGWALRGNQTCQSGENTCGRIAGVFVACCPSTSACITQYNDVCCPPSKPRVCLPRFGVLHCRRTSHSFQIPTAPTLSLQTDPGAPTLHGSCA